MDDYIKIRYGFNTMEEYVDAEYNKLVDAESLSHDGTLIIDPEYGYEVRYAIVDYLDFDNIADDHMHARGAVLTKKMNRDAKYVEKRLALLMEIAAEFPDSWQGIAINNAHNPFVEPEDYKPATHTQVSITYRDKFINKLMNLGVSANLSKKIQKTLINL